MHGPGYLLFNSLVFTMQKIIEKILIIDDGGFADDISVILSALDYTHTELYNSSYQATKAIEESRGKPDLIFINEDITGSMSGIETLEWVKSHDSTIQVILFGSEDELKRDSYIGDEFCYIKNAKLEQKIPKAISGVERFYLLLISDILDARRELKKTIGEIKMRTKARPDGAAWSSDVRAVNAR